MKASRNHKPLSFWEISIYLFIALNIMTFIHELGHYTALHLFGCNAQTPVVWFYFGATPFQCSTHALQPWQWWVVAYAGPLFAFIASLFLWFYFGKDSLERLAAIPGFLYGVLPNLVWQIQGTDAYFAVSQGFPASWATIIMIGALSYIGYLLYLEVADFQ